MPHITFRISEELEDKITQLAEATGYTKTFFFKKCLELYMPTVDKLFRKQIKATKKQLEKIK
ncbi:hypothetical protein FACS189496_4660 [Bacilli bacterium]|nr:hypothetical protein FACS189496_4590 [Bacilli bacterium]GHU53347.1 hypothetical protein FACS189496_4660 [Bacilli bacterium]